MNLSYGVGVIIDAQFSYETIYNIISKGVNIDFLYYAYIPGKDYEDCPLLDAEEATKKILTFIALEDPYGRNVRTKYHDTTFTLFCYPMEKSLKTEINMIQFTSNK